MPYLKSRLIVPVFMLTLVPLLTRADASAPAAQDVNVPDSSFNLLNDTIGAAVTVKGGRLSELSVSDRVRSTSLTVAAPFAILFKNGTIYDARNLRIIQSPVAKNLSPNRTASRLAERHSGQRLDIPFESDDRLLRGVLSIVVHSGENYLRQELTITATSQDLAINRVQLIDLQLPDAHVTGTVDGSPIVAGHLFVGFEHPLSKSRVTGNRATGWIDRELPLRAGQSVTYSSVIGVARDGQMRRDFLAYLEQERAHPYRTFLHYNSWYDLGFFTPYTEGDAIDRVRAFGRELTEKRGVKLDSFLFDDGWDNHKSLWKFNTGFPNGFGTVKAEAEKFNADPGVWMSPWGGYSKPKQERMEFAKTAGYEVIANGYALSGPKYYDAFRAVCMDMIRTYGVNQFKFDGTGNVDSVFPGSRFDSDFAAAIHLIGELRDAKPDIFINLTTGTWPSPFWVIFADSIWRGGEDDSTAGVGPYRERWITYRDAQTYRRVVQGGPLYPLNSLMLHGLIFAQFHKDLKQDPGNDFRNEVRSYFGTGTQLQEMYITPSLLTEKNWDDLAEAANWSRKNAEVLRDTHWIGGDPELLEVYGWASWTPDKGILVLRNPSNQEQTVPIKLQDAFELPQGAVQVYAARSPWKDDAGRPAIELDAREAHEFHLAPFQVLTLDILPKQTVHE
jgi:hypothetical protein